MEIMFNKKIKLIVGTFLTNTNNNKWVKLRYSSLGQVH